MNFRLEDILVDIDRNDFVAIINDHPLFCFLNLEAEIVYMSQSLKQAFDLRQMADKPQKFTTLFPSACDEDGSNFAENLITSSKWKGSFKCQKEQDATNVEVVFTLLEDNKGDPIYYLGVFQADAALATEAQTYAQHSSYKWFFKKSPAPQALLDYTTFKYVDVNRSWENYTGIKWEDAIGQSPKKLKIHELFDKDFTSKMHGAPYGHVASSRLHFYRGNEAKEGLISFEKIKLDSKTYVLANITDFSEQLKFQSELKDLSKKSIKKKLAILKLSELVGGDLRFIFEEVTRLCAEVLEIDRINIWKFSEDASSLTCISSFGIKEKNRSIDYEIQTSDLPVYFELLLKNKLLVINDAVKHKLTKSIAKDYLQPMGVASSLDVVVPGNEKPYGIVCFMQTAAGKDWSVEDEEFASSIANIISLAVECQKRSNVETELKYSNRQLLAVNEELKKLKMNLEQENIYLREEIDLVFNYEEMVYGSKSFSQVLTDVEQVAATSATVLLLGESGTGKELLARAIHNISPRKNKPLIKVNCAAIPRELLESELFGHKKGSFTGAISDKLGKFQLADGGTLFLDEIGELPLEMQPKLLRAIQESEVEQIGSTVTQKVNIRIIAATNRNLETEVKEKRFREDLFFRINVFPIVIPPLRERVEDIPILIEHFVNKYTKLYNKKITFISQATKHNLQTYPWPGNVRELENLIERAVILSNDNVLMIPNFKSSPAEALISSTVLSLEDVQRIHIKKILKKCDWKIDGVGGASDLLQIKPSTLRDRMKKLGIEKES